MVWRLVCCVKQGLRAAAGERLKENGDRIACGKITGAAFMAHPRFEKSFGT